MTSTAAAATKVTPKKAKASSKKPAATKASHPTYFEMIKEALLALHERSGSSPYAISKYIEEKHKTELPAHFKKILSHQLRNSVANGKLIKIKASYKLSDVGKKVTSAKPAVEKKPKATKPAKTAAATKTTKTAKPAAASKAKVVKKPAAAKKPVVEKAKKVVKAAKKVVKAAKKVAVKKATKATKATPVKRKALKSIKSPATKKAKKA